MQRNVVKGCENPIGLQSSDQFAAERRARHYHVVEVGVRYTGGWDHWCAQTALVKSLQRHVIGVPACHAVILNRLDLLELTEQERGDELPRQER